MVSETVRTFLKLFLTFLFKIQKHDFLTFFCVDAHTFSRTVDAVSPTWTVSLALKSMIEMNASTSLATRSHGRARCGSALVTAPIPRPTVTFPRARRGVTAPISFSWTWILRISARCLQRDVTTWPPPASHKVNRRQTWLTAAYSGFVNFYGPITIAIRTRYNILRRVMYFRAIMNMSILSRCCRML